MDPVFFIRYLADRGLDFYTGVPDSLLKNLCSCLSSQLPSGQHVTAANEGGAVGIAAGYHLATGKIPVVYMQNSGLGNTVNPLLSLSDPAVYHLPVLLLIGWRGEPGIKDEPQHVTQGRLTLNLLNSMEIPHAVLSGNALEAERQLEKAAELAKQGIYALVIRKNFFDAFPSAPSAGDAEFPLVREEAIREVLSSLPSEAVVVSTTGMISREVFELRESSSTGHQRDFLTVGSMGHASQIALGIALARPDRNVCCVDGDGAVLMHMGGLAIIGQSHARNITHVVLNNGAHDSVGGQKTVALDIHLPDIAKACGYKTVLCASNFLELQNSLHQLENCNKPAFLEIKVRKGARANLGRPSATPLENKLALMNFLAGS